MTAAEAMRRYADQRIFRDADTWEMPRRPFNRSLRPQALGAVKLEQPLTAKAFMNYESLAAQRVLTCVYEQDLVFLPPKPYTGWKADFDLFYSSELRDLAGDFRSELEAFCFSYLEEEVEVSSGWTRDDFTEYLADACRPQRRCRPGSEPSERARTRNAPRRCGWCSSPPTSCRSRRR